MEWEPIILSLKLALITTAILLIAGIPLSYWLAYTKSKFKPLIETIVSLPLVLPPTVIGFYLLLVLSPENSFGAWMANTMGLQLIFSFHGLVVGSVIYSFPFMIQPLQAGFSSLSPSLREAAYLMEKSKWTTIFRVLLPNIRPALLTGIVLSFAHTIGEFGVVLMIGGSKAGETKVASIAIYEQVEMMRYDAANQYALVLLGITFVILFIVYFVNGGYLKKLFR